MLIESVTIAKMRLVVWSCSSTYARSRTQPPIIWEIMQYVRVRLQARDECRKLDKTSLGSSSACFDASTAFPSITPSDDCMPKEMMRVRRG